MFIFLEKYILGIQWMRHTIFLLYFDYSNIFWFYINSLFFKRIYNNNYYLYSFYHHSTVFIKNKNLVLRKILTEYFNIKKNIFNVNNHYLKFSQQINFYKFDFWNWIFPLIINIWYNISYCRFRGNKYKEVAWA